MLLPIFISFFWLFPSSYTTPFNHVFQLERRQSRSLPLHVSTPPRAKKNPQHEPTITPAGGGLTNPTKANQRGTDIPKALVSSPYNLLWSPRMPRKLVLTGLALAIAHRTLLPLIPTAMFHGLRHRHGTAASIVSHQMQCWVHQLALPMLASACCLLQLLLNALSIGCAGYNKHLGPVRPYFVGLLFYLSVVNVSKYGFFYEPVQLMFRWTMALLPELLFAWDRVVYSIDQQQRRRRINHDKEVGTTIATITFAVPTMGCVACVNGIQNAVARVDGVESVTSKLLDAGGETIVRLSPKSSTPVAVTEQQIIKAITDSGFPGSKVIATTS